MGVPYLPPKVFEQINEGKHFGNLAPQSWLLLSINPALAKPADGDDEEEEEDDDGACPDEWTSIAGGCYQFLPEKYSWEDAKEACHMLHGWLVEIESEEQNDAIHDEAKKQDGWKTAWIGLTDTAEEGEWVWSSGKATDFTNWAPAQPSNTKQQRNK